VLLLLAIRNVVCVCCTLCTDQLQQVASQPNGQTRVDAERKLQRQKQDLDQQLSQKAQELLQMRLVSCKIVLFSLFFCNQLSCATIFVVVCKKVISLKRHCAFQSPMKYADDKLIFSSMNILCKCFVADINYTVFMSSLAVTGY